MTTTIRAVLLAASVALSAPAAAAPSPQAAPVRVAAGPAVPGARGPDAVRPWFEAHLPAPLLGEGPRGLLWWQWVALPVLVLLAMMGGSFLGWVTRRILGHLASRTQTTWDDVLLERIASPLTAMWAIALVTVLHPWLLLDDAAALVLHHVLRAATYLAFFWAGFRSVDVAFAAMAEAPWTRTSAGLTGLLPLGRKLSKVILLAIGLVAVLNELGFQVASLLAGLGIGGIAIALAAQKTVEHLFGSVAIGVDQPFRVGDVVKVEDVTGTVESIGMRSTRIRTLDRTIVTYPNGKLADMKSETFAARDRIRLLVNLGLSYDTTAAQLREILGQVEAALLSHPRLAADAPSVRLSALNESTMNVEVIAWFATAEWGQFTAIRQDLLLAFLEIVERAGARLAFPTRTVRVVSEGGAEVGARGATRRE
jgi:MscS family membrane protein